MKGSRMTVDRSTSCVWMAAPASDNSPESMGSLIRDYNLNALRLKWPKCSFEALRLKMLFSACTNQLDIAS